MAFLQGCRKEPGARVLKKNARAGFFGGARWGTNPFWLSFMVAYRAPALCLKNRAPGPFYLLQQVRNRTVFMGANAAVGPLMALAAALGQYNLLLSSPST